MDFFNKYSVKLRVTLLMLLFIILITSLGLFTLQRISILHDLTDTLYNHPLQVSNAALRAKTGVIRMHRSMKDVALSNSQLELDLAINRVQDDEKLVYEDLATVRTLILGEEGQKLVNETIQMFAGWKPIRMEVEQLVIEGKKIPAARITREKGADYVAMLERQMNELTSYAHGKADGFIMNARETHSDIRDKMIWIIFIVSVICLASAFIVIGGITRSVHTLQEKMAESVTKGKLEKVDMPGSNEFTVLAKHFNTLVTTIEEQLQTSKYINDLNHILTGDKELSELYHHIISFITRTVNGCASAIYHFDEQKELCTLRAQFASIERVKPSETFKLGEGGIGQVALERSPLRIDNIGSSDVQVKSATYQQSPVSIYTVPIVFDQKILAVLEIAFLNPITSSQQQFIDQAANSIGGVLNSALQNTRIKQLLLESQEANKLLEVKSSEVGDKNEELNALNKELKAQATELQVQKNELEIQRNQVERADRLKSEFLSNMSHELRTPLNSILSLSQLLISKGVDKDIITSNEYIHVIDRNGRQLLHLINDILDLTKIESGKMELYPEEFSLDNLLVELKDTVSPLAARKNLQISFSQQEPVTLNSDRDKIRQILLNLLSNAIKFSETGTIQLETDSREGNLTFHVKDEGMGISETDQKLIFNEFTQVDGSFTRSHDGTGLGLAICTKLAALLGGTISLSSELGVGSIFSLTIPLMLTGNNSTFTPNTATSHNYAGNMDGRNTILVIDDDEHDRAEISALLNQSGYRAVEAPSGKTGLNLAKEMKPNLISLDLVMPGMDGWEALQMLKSDPATTAIPVIITSQIEEEETSRALGAAGCIQKPIDKDDFLSKIEEISGQGKIQSILVVDDDLGVRQYFKDILVENGYSVDQAQNGAVALEKYRQSQPDLIVLDLIMPVMDGFSFLKKLEANSSNDIPPVIVVTSKDLSHDDLNNLTGTAETFTKQKLDKQVFLKTVAKVLNESNGEVRKPLQSDKSAILVVDDNEVAGEQIQIVLEEHDFDVMLARDGEQALKFIEQRIPDGIVLDLMMPKIDGFGVLESIRSGGETAEIPVLVLTAKEITIEERQLLTNNNVHQLIQKGATDRDQLAASVLRMVEPERMQADDTASFDSRKNTILVVEDNKDNRFTVQAIFKNEGFNLVFAEDGQAGIDYAYKYSPDLILMDIQLPDLSGIDAMKQLKSDSKMDQIPIIALTAKAMKGDREELLAEGFDDYAPKPINPDELIAKVKNWLKAEG